jgi:hypothetical protein
MKMQTKVKAPLSLLEKARQMGDFATKEEAAVAALRAYIELRRKLAVTGEFRPFRPDDPLLKQHSDKY